MQKNFNNRPILTRPIVASSPIGDRAYVYENIVIECEAPPPFVCIVLGKKQ